MFTNIATAYDESEEAARALKAATGLAKALGASLHAITVAEELPAYTAYGLAGDSSIYRQLSEERLRFYADMQSKVRETALAQGVDISTHLLNGDKIDAIVHFVHEHKIDLIVIGLHHRSLRVSRLWSTVYTLAQELPCSILGVH
jgi:nucleotide-binding universal stress UspA family protein